MLAGSSSYSSLSWKLIQAKMTTTAVLEQLISVQGTDDDLEALTLQGTDDDMEALTLLLTLDSKDRTLKCA